MTGGDVARERMKSREAGLERAMRGSCRIIVCEFVPEGGMAWFGIAAGLECLDPNAKTLAGGKCTQASLTEQRRLYLVNLFRTTECLGLGVAAGPRARCRV